MIKTKERILNAAEKLFAQKGYGATSLRSIIAEAEVNVAAVHYHYRSKESLLEAVLVRRVEPANRERLAMLERCEREANGGPPSLERVLEAFLVPTFRIAADRSHNGQRFVRLMGRLHAESDLLPGMIASRFGPVLLRFGEALSRALPEMPPRELYWRSWLAMGAAAQVLRNPPPDWEPTLRRLITYLSAGFRAPVETAQAQEMK
jgi:AcrR family transcriptional regulator